jgi:hypothetical protein
MTMPETQPTDQSGAFAEIARVLVEYVEGAEVETLPNGDDQTRDHR